MRNKRVTIRSFSLANTKGEEVKTWSDTADRWAEWNFGSVGERFKGQFYETAVGHYRFHSDSVTRAITALDRIVDGDYTWNVVGAHDPDGRKKDVLVFVDKVI